MRLNLITGSVIGFAVGATAFLLTKKSHL